MTTDYYERLLFQQAVSTGALTRSSLPHPRQQKETEVLVAEAVGVFQNDVAAKQQFDTLKQAVEQCSQAPFDQVSHGTRVPGEHTTKFRLLAVSQGKDTVRWQLPEETSRQSGLHCPLAAGVKGRVLFEFAVCSPLNIPIPWDKLLEVAMQKIPG